MHFCGKGRNTCALLALGHHGFVAIAHFFLYILGIIMISSQRGYFALNPGIIQSFVKGKSSVTSTAYYVYVPDICNSGTEDIMKFLCSGKILIIKTGNEKHFLLLR